MPCLCCTVRFRALIFYLSKVFFPHTGVSHGSNIYQHADHLKLKLSARNQQYLENCGFPLLFPFRREILVGKYILAQGNKHRTTNWNCNLQIDEQLQVSFRPAFPLEYRTL